MYKRIEMDLTDEQLAKLKEEVGDTNFFIIGQPVLKKGKIVFGACIGATSSQHAQAATKVAGLVDVMKGE